MARRFLGRDVELPFSLRDAAAGVASLRSLGSGPLQAAAGDHLHTDTYAHLLHDHFGVVATGGFTYHNNWQPYGDPWGPAFWWKDINRVVHFEGLIGSGGASFVANQLVLTFPTQVDGGASLPGSGSPPHNLRPTINQIFVQPMRGGGQAGDGELRVDRNGNVTIGDRGGPANPGEWISLGGISFRTQGVIPVAR